MSGTNPDDDGLDRTQAFRPEGADGPKAPSPDLPRIPGITLHHEIARGGMGVVYSGRQDFLDRRVAVKLLSADLAGEKFAQRFRREATILAGIKHPNIVACHSAGTTDEGQSYLVMEFVDGPSLKAWIVEQGAMPSLAALRLTKAVALALAHAHQLGVIHRDVKPENILLESVTSTAIDIAFPYVPKVVDLGLARMTSESAAGYGLTVPGAVMGTPSTMSPEQFDDPDSVDFRTDIYGLGCVLYEMLVGAAAYRGNKLTEIVARKRQPIGPNPCEEAAQVPAAVGALVCSMLAANRDDRPSSYRELDQRIDELLAVLANQRPQRPGGSRPLPFDPTATRPASSTPTGASGAGLLRTAEVEFLQAGGGVGADTATPAFRERTAGAASTTPPAPARRRRGLLVGGLGALAVIAAGVWFATRGGGSGAVVDGGGGGETPKPPVVVNHAPTGARIDGEQRLVLSQWTRLVALAADADGDVLQYSWTVPEEIQTADQVQNTIRVRAIDGLPDEPFAIGVAISDGHHEPVVATCTLTLADEGFPGEKILDGIKDDARWTFAPNGTQLAWTKLLEQDVVACNAGNERRSATIDMGPETFWQLTGKLLPRAASDDVFASIAVRVELGDDGWSLICRRGDEMGVGWSIELVTERRLAGAWEPKIATGAPRRVDWVEAADAGDYPYAEVGITRRRDTIALRWGQGVLFQHETLTIPAGTEPHVTLWVDHGSGEFREFTRR